MGEPAVEQATGGEQKTEQYVPWSRFNGVLNENKELKGNVESMRGEMETMKETLAGFQPGGNGAGNGQAADIYGDPDRYVSDRVKVGVDEALAARDTASRETQRKTNEAAAVALLQGTPEWKTDPQAADRDYAEVLKEMRMNPAEYARAAILLYNDMRKADGGKEEGAQEDKNGNRRVTKQAVASLKGKSSGNGGFSRSQIRGMSPEEFTKNQDAILRAGQEGNISDD